MRRLVLIEILFLLAFSPCFSQVYPVELGSRADTILTRYGLGYRAAFYKFNDNTVLTSAASILEWPDTTDRIATQPYVQYWYGLVSSAHNGLVATVAHADSALQDSINLRARDNAMKDSVEALRTADNSFGVWNRQGVVIYTQPDATLGYNLAGEITLVEPEDNPRVLTADTSRHSYRKAWFTDGRTQSIRYTESIDGVNWTWHPRAILANHQRPFVIDFGGTRYLFAARYSPNQIDSYVLTNDTLATPLDSNIVVADSSAWDFEGQHDNISGVVSNDTLYLFIDGTGVSSQGYQVGLWATKNCKTVWEVVTDSPVVARYTTPDVGFGSPSHPKLIDGRWYIWGHCVSPPWNDILRYSAPAKTGPWTFDCREVVVGTEDEGLGSKWGQLADPDIMEINGKTYLYTSASHGDTNFAFSVIKLFTADMSLSEVVKREGGANVNSIATSKEIFGLKYNYYENSLDFNHRSIKNFSDLYPETLLGNAEFTIHGALLVDKELYIGDAYPLYMGNNSRIGHGIFESPALQFSTGAINILASTSGVQLGSITNSGIQIDSASFNLILPSASASTKSIQIGPLDGGIRSGIYGRDLGAGNGTAIQIENVKANGGQTVAEFNSINGRVAYVSGGGTLATTEGVNTPILTATTKITLRSVSIDSLTVSGDSVLVWIGGTGRALLPRKAP